MQANNFPAPPPPYQKLADTGEQATELVEPAGQPAMAYQPNQNTGYNTGNHGIQMRFLTPAHTRPRPSAESGEGANVSRRRRAAMAVK